MRSHLLRSLVLGATSLVIASAGAAQGNDARASLLVTPQWLGQHLRDPNLVLFHVGTKEEYDKQHIPGAHFLDLHALYPMDMGAAPTLTLSLEMQPADSLRAGLAKLGVSNDSRIVIYYGSDWVSPATRIVLTMDYAGLGQATSLLDGGMPAWVRAGNQPTDVVPPPRTGTLAALKIKPVVVTAEFLRDNIGKPGFAVVDGRAGVFYDGVSEGGPPDARRRGHIAGALSVPFTSVVNDRNEWRSPAELTSLFSVAGVKPGDTVIGYCHIGLQATAMLFAARTLGYKVLLYDGSFEDWARKGWAVDTSKTRK